MKSVSGLHTHLVKTRRLTSSRKPGPTPLLIPVQLRQGTNNSSAHEPLGERRITPKQLTRGTKHRPCRKDTQVARSFLPRRDIRYAARTNRNDRTPPCGLYTPQKHEQPERRGRGQGESDTGADVERQGGEEDDAASQMIAETAPDCRSQALQYPGPAAGGFSGNPRPTAARA